jgi:hypothetical protein
MWPGIGRRTERLSWVRHSRAMADNERHDAEFVASESASAKIARAIRGPLRRSAAVSLAAHVCELYGDHTVGVDTVDQRRAVKTVGNIRPHRRH